MQHISTPIRIQEAEANAAHNGNCLYFRCKASRTPGGQPSTLFYYHGHSATQPEDISLKESCGAFHLINFKAKDNSRPYQYLRERTWIPVTFSRPPSGTKWEFQAIPTRYFGQLHAEPRDCRTINNAIRSTRRLPGEQSPAASASHSPGHVLQRPPTKTRLIAPNNTPSSATRNRTSNSSTSSSNSSRAGPSLKDETSGEDGDLPQEEEEPYEEVYEGGWIPSDDYESNQVQSNPETASLSPPVLSVRTPEHGSISPVEDPRHSANVPALDMADQQATIAQLQAFLDTLRQRIPAEVLAAADVPAATGRVPDPLDEDDPPPRPPRTENRAFADNVWEAGRLLARLDQLKEAISWREAALERNVQSFPLRVGPLQSPSSDLFEDDVADQLNTTLSDCAKRCSEIVLTAQRQALAKLTGQKDRITRGWTRTDNERLAIQEVRRMHSRPPTRHQIPTEPQRGPTQYFLPPGEHGPIKPNYEIVRDQSTGSRRSQSRNRSNSRNRNRSNSRNRNRNRNRGGNQDRSPPGGNQDQSSPRILQRDQSSNRRGNGLSVRFSRRDGLHY